MNVKLQAEMKEMKGHMNDMSRKLLSLSSSASAASVQSGRTCKDRLFDSTYQTPARRRKHSYETRNKNKCKVERQAHVGPVAP